jgi:hypothetical protein
MIRRRSSSSSSSSSSSYTYTYTSSVVVVRHRSRRVMAVVVVAVFVVAHHRPHRSEVHDQAEHYRVRGPDDRVDPMRRRMGGDDGGVGLARLRRKTGAAAAAVARPLADFRRSFAHTATLFALRGRGRMEGRRRIGRND